MEQDPPSDMIGDHDDDDDGDDDYGDNGHKKDEEQDDGSENQLQDDESAHSFIYDDHPNPIPGNISGNCINSFGVLRDMVRRFFCAWYWNVCFAEPNDAKQRIPKNVHNVSISKLIDAVLKSINDKQPRVMEWKARLEANHDISTPEGIKMYITRTVKWVRYLAFRVHVDAMKRHLSRNPKPNARKYSVTEEYTLISTAINGDFADLICNKWYIEFNDDSRSVINTPYDKKFTVRRCVQTVQNLIKYVEPVVSTPFKKPKIC